MLKRVLASTILQVCLIFIGLGIVQTYKLQWMFTVVAVVVAICIHRGIEVSLEKRASRRHAALVAQAMSKLPLEDLRRMT